MGLYHLYSRKEKAKLQLASEMWRSYWYFLFSYSFSLSLKYLNCKKPQVLKFDVWEESEKERNETRQVTPLIEKIFMPRKITYIDIDPVLVRKAKKLMPEKKNDIIRGNITHMPFKCKSFDLVVDFSTTDHLTEKEFHLALKETHRVLKVNGLYLLYHLNNKYFNIEEWNKIYTMDLIPSFPRELDKVVQKLRKNGFKILHHFYFLPFFFDVTLRWFYFFSKHKKFFELMPAQIKYFFFNSPSFNLFFFILAKKKG